MTAYILMPGSHHGGGWYEDVVAGLSAEGHRAVAMTLEGLDREKEPPSRTVNLDDHVAQTVAELNSIPTESARKDGRDTVLVGHSYGGSVITGVADALPERVRALVYLDALLPEDGDSSWSMTNDDEHDWYISGSARSGTFVDTLPSFDERARPHPLATLMQASTLSGRWRQVPVKHCVEATEWPGESPMAAMAQRAKNDLEITVHQ